MQKQNIPLAIILVAVLGICLLGCLGIGFAVRFGPNIFRHSPENNSIKIGSTAPDFELTSLEGQRVRLSQFRGKPVLLSIGATWCPDCRKEAPLLETLHKSYPELVVLLVDSQESPAIVRNFADEIGISHPILLDSDGSVLKQYQVFAIPTELFIDANGLVKARLIESVTPKLLADQLSKIGVNP